LALCQPSSVKPDDLDCMDNVFPNNVEESISLHYSEQQDWCFIDRQTENEILIFQGGDSESGMAGGVPHCSFEYKLHDSKPRRRESIEVRALVFYVEEKLALERVLPSRRHGPKSTYHQEILPATT